jgi:formate dehydrogenase iron-sulfur subunit
MKIYVPCDAAALAVGADAVARAIEQQLAARRIDGLVVRNGSLGLFWLEPLVEVQTPEGRVAYGPVTAESVEELFESGFLKGGAHSSYLGLTEEIPYLKRQERLTFARCGITDL